MMCLTKAAVEAQSSTWRKGERKGMSKEKDNKKVAEVPTFLPPAVPLPCWDSAHSSTREVSKLSIVEYA
ncbi:hypothetical protein EYF80_012381 [Liparis tanakae]|uniref:Uncharacterized protein n=1 Tax=Liparis tanakae TaxID=230148 RepID=A0A4Z2II18_9TELE|nr:hypothetical protein EYF80_012381 [Liparis tanakae]